MSCCSSSSSKKEFIKKEEMELETEKSLKNNQNLVKQQRSIGLPFMIDHNMSQTISLFRKYLLSKADQSNLGKTNMEEESHDQFLTKRSSRSSLRPLVPPNFGSSRHASFLEQKLLPGLCKENATECQSDGMRSPATQQLTIFYAGAICVFDNVPLDKAQEIMQLAGESSLSEPVTMELQKPDTFKFPKEEMTKKSLHSTKLFCKLQADLPIARKTSLHHFLEKRRSRIVNNKAPYNSTPSRAIKGESRRDVSNIDNNNNNKSLSLCPFPSRLGYFCPVAAQKSR